MAANFKSLSVDSMRSTCQKLFLWSARMKPYAECMLFQLFCSHVLIACKCLIVIIHFYVKEQGKYVCSCCDIPLFCSVCSWHMPDPHYLLLHEEQAAQQAGGHQHAEPPARWPRRRMRKVESLFSFLILPVFSGYVLFFVDYGNARNFAISPSDICYVR